MAFYTERNTTPPIVVDITCATAFRDLNVVAIVTYPDGTRYGMLASNIDPYFEIVTPQVVGLAGGGGVPYDRT